MLIELFSPGVTAEALPVKIDKNRRFGRGCQIFTEGDLSFLHR